jgi:hypothetical protein
MTVDALYVFVGEYTHFMPWRERQVMIMLCA